MDLNMEIKEINKETLRIVRGKLEEVLGGMDLPIRFTVGGIRFSDANFTVKLEAALIVDGEVKSKEAAEFEQYAGLVGLKPEDLGRQFKANGKMYTISGLKMTNHKYPIIATNRYGQPYKFTETQVKLALGVL